MAATIWTDPIIPATNYPPYVFDDLIGRDEAFRPTPEVLSANDVLQLQGGGVSRPASGIVFP